MEQALAAKKPVEIYGIYFDFNSATIKPESEAVLREIADIMRKNPDWKLSVSGHTDNIGGDPQPRPVAASGRGSEGRACCPLPDCTRSAGHERIRRIAADRVQHHA